MSRKIINMLALIIFIPGLTGCPPGGSVNNTGGAYSVTTLAGTPFSMDAIGAAANFKMPSGVARVGDNLYVTDSDNNTIRKITISTGEVSTFAGMAGSRGSTDGLGVSARFSYPNGVASDGTHLYVADTFNNAIRKIAIATGEVTTVAGSLHVNGYADGTGSAAQFRNPYGITTDGINLYVADTENHTLRKIAPSGGNLNTMTSANAVVTTLAGSGQSNPGNTDATGTAAQFRTPKSITTDGINLYVADTYNNAIRKIAPASGSLNDMTSSNAGVTTLATFFNSYQLGIIVADNSLIVADTGNYRLRKLTPVSGSLKDMTSANVGVSTLAGGSNGSMDGTGVAAQFNHPSGLGSDGSNLYVADSDNATIRQVVMASGVVTTLAGTAVGRDGTGSVARFGSLANIASDGTYLFMADQTTIRKIAIQTGEVTTHAGTTGTYGSIDGTGSLARLYGAIGVTIDGSNLYIAESVCIRKLVINTAEVTTLAGNCGLADYRDTTGTEAGTAARFWNISGITTDGSSLYVVDTYNNAVRKIAPASGNLSDITSASAVVTTLAGGGPGTQSYVDGIGMAARFFLPHGITTDGNNLYIADTVNNVVRKIAPISGSLNAMTSNNAMVTTLAGSAGNKGSTDATGTAAQFNFPKGMTTDGVSLFVTDTGNHTIRKITPLDGNLSTMANSNAVVTTLAGSSGNFGVVNGAGSSARFWSPWGITKVGTRLFISDSDAGTVRMMQ